MRDDTRETLVGCLSDYPSVVEIGVGHRVCVARDLAAAGVDVTATDVRERTVPAGVAFVLDDITAPDLSVYASADAIYALDLPPELHRPVHDLARDLSIPFLFTTLGTDPPAVPVSCETIPGETLFVAREQFSPASTYERPRDRDDSQRV